MKKIKRQVTLTAEAIAALEQEGLGSLSTGIEMVWRNWMRGVAPSKAATPEKEPEPDKPIDPRNPTGHAGTASRLAREDAEAAAATKEAYDKPRREFEARVRHCIEWKQDHHWKPFLDGYKADYAEIPPEEQQAIINAALMDPDLLAAHAAAMATYKQPARPEPAATNPHTLHVQTLRLSAKALKGLGMFGTPESMTDEQIKEINADWEHRELPVAAED